MSTLQLLDAAGRRRSPATLPGFHAGRPPRNKGFRYPPDPPRVEEIIAVMRRAGETDHGLRLRALIVVLWRAGLRIGEAMALTEPDLDPSKEHFGPPAPTVAWRALTPHARRDTARWMSQKNVEAFKRGSDAANRRDIDALLAVLDPEVEWHPAMAALLEGATTVYRGHEGVRTWLRDQEESFAESRIDYSEIRGLGERVVAIGRLHTRGKESGAEIESPVGWVAEFKNGKVIRAMAYLDPKEALEAAGLSE